MNVRTALLGLFVALTIVFASVAAEEAYFGGKITSTATRTIIAGTTTATVFPPGTLYDVTFNEGQGCGSYIDQWGVQLGNLTITQPPNIPLAQIPESGYNASGAFRLTTITFSVPSGTYPFVLYPTEFSRPPDNNSAVGDLRGSGGTVTVASSDVTIDDLSGVICA